MHGSALLLVAVSATSWPRKRHHVAVVDSTLDTAFDDERMLLLLLRRILLLLCTWLTAHIYNLLHEISNASRAHLDGSAAGTAVSKSIPVSLAPRLRAGFSCPKVAKGSAASQHVWTTMEADQFKVRHGPDYRRNGIKKPSAPAMGEVVAVDVLRTERKIFDLLSLNHIELPPATEGWNEVYPEFLVINQMLPVHFNNSLFTNARTDVETFNLIVYVRLKPNLAPDWKSDQDPRNAEELLKRFLLRADQDPAVAHCFKEIGVVRNLEELSHRMPSALFSLMKKFNGKPVLTRPEHYFHRDPHNRYFMCDLDGHCYQYMTRHAISGGMNFVGEIQLGYGYVVEARKEQEMPEVMICSCEIFRMQHSKTPTFPPSAPDS
mmetsp:Transcript_18904/g.48327  ORF Transcript_18904/g.48327 Transcript_18904/m.48327 type:complete len:377 (+) Transcript_18904:57-1187(+)